MEGCWDQFVSELRFPMPHACPDLLMHHDRQNHVDTFRCHLHDWLRTSPIPSHTPPLTSSAHAGRQFIDEIRTPI